MSLKDVSIWIGNKNDQVVNITLNGNNYSAATVSQLVSTHSTVFSFVSNPNGQTDLAFKLVDTIPYIIGSFKEYSTGVNYGAQSWDYIGGQPKTRCPQCP